METAAASPTVLFLALLFLSCCYGPIKVVNGEKNWCVAQPYASNQTLINNINYACTKVDCKVIQPGGECYEPNTLMNHASVAMNLYYQANNRKRSACNFNGSGTIAIIDPSWGHCKYA